MFEPPAMFLASCGVLLLSVSALSSFKFAHAQSPQPNGSMQGSWPQAYPGMPRGDYSPEWQNYFQVTESLPNVTWPLSRNWAGNIPVQRMDHPDDTLFFWAFESSNGSFTANSSEPWGIWLNGGPGASSLIGLLFENGPIHILGDYSVVENHNAWTNVADYVWIDQPVGTGYGTADTAGYVVDEDQLGRDFMGFLANFVKVFPNLASRPLHLTGESYAGTFIPYITKAYFEMDNPPINLARIAIGDGALTSLETFNELPVVSVLETYPQIIGYDTQVFEYFREQSALCGYNLTLQYPQPAPFPTLHAPIPYGSGGSSGKTKTKFTKRRLLNNARDRLAAKLSERGNAFLEHGERLRARDLWKRDLSGRANGTIDPLYQCDLYSEMVDYAINFTFPCPSFQASGGEFNFYNIPDALSPEVAIDASVFLNDPRTRAAIHAPASKDWQEVIHPFLPNNSTSNQYGDPSVEPMAFLSDIATNATTHDMKIIIYSGNDDSLVPHLGSQVAIQNTTFGGIRGFTRRPDTPWFNDAGEFAGIVHQERGWTYVLVTHAGHLLGYTNPISALTLVREFIFGNNQTGLVINTNSEEGSVVGGEVSSLGNEIMTGQAAIYYGSGTTASSYFFPSATVEAWNTYMATATAATVEKRTSHANSILSTLSVALQGSIGVALTVTFWMFFL